MFTLLPHSLKVQGSNPGLDLGSFHMFSCVCGFSPVSSHGPQTCVLGSLWKRCVISVSIKVYKINETISKALQPAGSHEWPLFGAMAALMRASNIVGAQRDGYDESDCGFLTWTVFPSLLPSSFTPRMFSALPGGASTLLQESRGRCTTGWGLLLRSCSMMSRNTHSVSCWSRGLCWPAGTESHSSRCLF